MTAHVLMYTTAVCPYCIRAKQLLAARGVTEIEEIRVDLDPVRREEMMARTQRRTVPRFLLAKLTSAGATTWWRWTPRGACAHCWPLRPELHHQLKVNHGTTKRPAGFRY